MPFMSVSAMDSRRKLAWSVLENGCSLSRACRSAGVTRKTGRKWVERAIDEGIAGMCERSRAPHVVASRTAPEVELALADLKARYPSWGAKKLIVRLKIERGMKLPLRTADRILDRLGLTRPREREPEPIRFERDRCGALLQMDFKGLPPSTPYALLTVLDDSKRFCLKFGPVPDKTGPSVIAALWELFGEHGLPDEMLMDNGDCWGGFGHGPTKVEAWLMRLGVHPIHGRPYHPQTQGKVERFHRTAKDDLGERLVQPSIRLAQEVCDDFVRRYNWIRPHESLAMQVPGSEYEPWPSKRPSIPPEHFVDDGQISRSVDDKGIFWFKGTQYLIGKGLHKERIVLREDEFGMRVFYAGFPLHYLHELTHARRQG